MAYDPQPQNPAEQTSQRDDNDSNFRSAEWRRQSDAWAITADLWESPLYIRGKEQSYLDKFKTEPPEKYQTRLHNSVFSNKFREAIEGMAGQVFRNDPTPREAPPVLLDLFTDIDLCGNSLHSFLLNAFELFLRDGNGFLYVDAPPLSDRVQQTIAEGRAPTLQERAADRPFWVFYSASQLINHRYERINGRDVLVQATLLESVTQPKGEFGEEAVIRHRVLRPGSVDVRVYNKEANRFISDPDQQYQTSLDHIPLTPIARIGSVPPLLVMALLNILYYNKISDFDDWCHIACVPERIYQFESKQDADAVTLAEIGPGNARKMWGEHSKAYFNEVSGAGIEIASARNKEIADEIAALGMGMFAPSDAAPKSATEVMDAAGRRQSKLARFARDFENAVEKTMYDTAEYMNAIRGGNTVNLGEAEKSSLKLGIDYDRLTFSLEQIKFFNELVTAGRLSKKTFYELLQNVVDLPADFNAEDEAAQIAKEGGDKQPTEIDDKEMPPKGTAMPLPMVQ